MKQCPQCGQQVSDSARKCKYCDAILPSLTETGDSVQPHLFQCPSCGAPLNHPGHGSTISCDYCHNTVIVPTTLRVQTQPAPETPIEPVTLSGQVEQLVQAGQHGKAIQFLREQLLLPRTVAEEVVSRMVSGQYGDAQTLILQARRGFK